MYACKCVPLLALLFWCGPGPGQTLEERMTNWTHTTSSLQFSASNDWAHIRNAVLHHGRLYVRTPHEISMDTLKFRRRLSQMDSPLDAMQLRFINNSVPCLCDRVEERPSFLANVVFWPHFGHTMYDGVTAIWSVIQETLTPVPDLLLYLNVGGADRRTDEDGNLDTGKFNDVFGAFSKYPPKSIKTLLEESHKSKICFKEITVGVGRNLAHFRSMMAPFNATSLRELADLVLRHLPVPEGLLNSSCQAYITVLDRQASRQILNVQSLAAELELALSREGLRDACVTLAALENMTMSEQLHLMRRTKVLVGVDGTGLLNAAFMPKCGGCVHIKPYFQELLDRGKEGEFAALCTKMLGHWRSWTSTNLSSSVFPDDLAEWADAAEAAQHNATALEEMREQLKLAQIKGWRLSRVPKLYVDPVPIAQMVQEIIRATKDGCSGSP